MLIESAAGLTFNHRILIAPCNRDAPGRTRLNLSVLVARGLGHTAGLRRLKPLLVPRPLPSFGKMGSPSRRRTT
jgi:hypothetical protein